MLSTLPGDLKVDEFNINDLLRFETTEIESDEYVKLIKHIQNDAEMLQDIKV